MEMCVNTWRERSVPPHRMPCQHSRCGLDIPDLTGVGVGSCSYDSDLQQPAVMSPLGEVDWRWGGQRRIKRWRTLLVCLKPDLCWHSRSDLQVHAALYLRRSLHQKYIYPWVKTTQITSPIIGPLGRYHISKFKYFCYRRHRISVCAFHLLQSLLSFLLCKNCSMINCCSAPTLK